MFTDWFNGVIEHFTPLALERGVGGESDLLSELLDELIENLYNSLADTNLRSLTSISTILVGKIAEIEAELVIELLGSSADCCSLDRNGAFRDAVEVSTLGTAR